MVGQAFPDIVDHAKVQGLLAKSGLDRYGRTHLQLPGDKQTASPVVVGFQHIDAAAACAATEVPRRGVVDRCALQFADHPGGSRA